MLQLCKMDDIISRLKKGERIMSRVPISVCMIAKNEEKYIEECLKKLKPYGFEIIVTDTGSSDKTKEIAQKYADKPRLLTMLNTTTLQISGDDSTRTIVFEVLSQAQKEAFYEPCELIELYGVNSSYYNTVLTIPASFQRTREIISKYTFTE